MDGAECEGFGCVSGDEEIDFWIDGSIEVMYLSNSWDISRADFFSNLY